MGIYLLLTITTIAVAFLVDSSQMPAIMTEAGTRGMHPTRRQMHNTIVVSAIFAALFLVSACRIAIGHDYWEYTEIFSLISQNRHVSTEFGFNLLVRICQWMFGTENYLVIFGIVAFATNFFFLKALYDQSEHFAYSFLMFMTFGYYLLTFNSIRYYLVLAIALYAIKFLMRKDYIRFVLCILFAACFHKAVLLVLIFYPLAKLKWKKWFLPVIGAICAFLLLCPDLIRRVIFIFYPFYEGSVYDTGDVSYVNIARSVGVMIFALIYYKAALKEHEVNRFYFSLNVMSIVVYCCCSFMPLVSRIGYFFSIGQLFLVPSVLRLIPSKKQRIVWTVLITLACVGYFAFFLKTCLNDDVRIIPYLNWILN